MNYYYLWMDKQQYPWLDYLYFDIEHFHVTLLLPCWRAKTIHFLSPGK